MAVQNSILSDTQINNDYGTLNYHPVINTSAGMHTLDAQSYNDLIESKTNLKITFMQNDNLIKQNNLLIKENHRLKRHNEKLSEERAKLKEDLARANEKIASLMLLADSGGVLTSGYNNKPAGYNRG